MTVRLPTMATTRSIQRPAFLSGVRTRHVRLKVVIGAELGECEERLGRETCLAESWFCRSSNMTRMSFAKSDTRLSPLTNRHLPRTFHETLVAPVAKLGYELKVSMHRSPRKQEWAEEFCSRDLTSPRKRQFRLPWLGIHPISTTRYSTNVVIWPLLSRNCLRRYLSPCRRSVKRRQRSVGYLELRGVPADSPSGVHFSALLRFQLSRRIRWCKVSMARSKA